MAGTVKWFNVTSGYGFISSVDSATNEAMDVFVHANACPSGGFLYAGESVEFQVQPSNRAGEQQATRVVRVSNEEHGIERVVVKAQTIVC